MNSVKEFIEKARLIAGDMLLDKVEISAKELLAAKDMGEKLENSAKEFYEYKRGMCETLADALKAEDKARDINSAHERFSKGDVISNDVLLLREAAAQWGTLENSAKHVNLSERGRELVEALTKPGLIGKTANGLNAADELEAVSNIDKPYGSYTAYHEEQMIDYKYSGACTVPLKSEIEAKFDSTEKFYSIEVYEEKLKETYIPMLREIDEHFGDYEEFQRAYGEYRRDKYMLKNSNSNKEGQMADVKDTVTEEKKDSKDYRMSPEGKVNFGQVQDRIKEVGATLSKPQMNALQDRMARGLNGNVAIKAVEKLGEIQKNDHWTRSNASDKSKVVATMTNTRAPGDGRIGMVTQHINPNPKPDKSPIYYAAHRAAPVYENGVDTGKTEWKRIESAAEKKGADGKTVMKVGEDGKERPEKIMKPAFSSTVEGAMRHIESYHNSVRWNNCVDSSIKEVKQEKDATKNADQQVDIKKEADVDVTD